MQIANCQRVTSVSRIKIEESGRKAIFMNLARDQFVLTRVDGCVVVDSVAADWVVDVVLVMRLLN